VDALRYVPVSVILKIKGAISMNLKMLLIKEWVYILRDVPLELLAAIRVFWVTLWVALGVAIIWAFLKITKLKLFWIALSLVLLYRLLF
jgi:hypothetical protein